MDYNVWKLYISVGHAKVHSKRQCITQTFEIQVFLHFCRLPPPSSSAAAALPKTPTLGVPLSLSNPATPPTPTLATLTPHPLNYRACLPTPAGPSQPDRPRLVPTPLDRTKRNAQSLAGPMAAKRNFAGARHQYGFVQPPVL
jgi:hypothetical protein